MRLLARLAQGLRTLFGAPRTRRVEAAPFGARDEGCDGTGAVGFEPTISGLEGRRFVLT